MFFTFVKYSLNWLAIILLSDEYLLIRNGVCFLPCVDLLFLSFLL